MFAAVGLSGHSRQNLLIAVVLPVSVSNISVCLLFPRLRVYTAPLVYGPAGMWRDGILSPANNATNTSGTSQVYTLTQNPGIFASNFVPLWTGLTEDNATQGARVVQALQNSSLIGPSGEILLACWSFRGQTCHSCSRMACTVAAMPWH